MYEASSYSAAAVALRGKVSVAASQKTRRELGWQRIDVVGSSAAAVALRGKVSVAAPEGISSSLLRY